MTHKSTPVSNVRIKHPEWSRDATIYQINTRQFTPEGTLNAARRQIGRLAELGVKILWLMPVHEIGEKNRKGFLGSPYAVRDYYSVSSELGTLEDLKLFVNEAHDMGLRVILDWVPNHTAWDNPLLEQHPEWYKKDRKNNCRPTPWWDWTDVIDLDYSNPGLREYMLKALKYWVEETDIDGYRCDVAGYVPVDFWELVRAELDMIKPVFMLAEWDSRDLHAAAFDMTYGWSWTQYTRRLASGAGNVAELHHYYANNQGAFPPEGMRMLGVSNHDYNAWDGTEYEIYGDSVEAMTVLSFISEGMPLIYNGQEAGNRKRLNFFDRDSIEWRDHEMNDLLTRLVHLKRQNPSLHNAPWGAPMIEVKNDDRLNIFSFIRQSPENSVLAVFNMSAESRVFHLDEPVHCGDYEDFTTGESVDLQDEMEMSLDPWGYRIFTSR